MTTDMYHHHPYASHPSRGLYADALQASSSVASPLTVSNTNTRRYHQPTEPSAAPRSYADYPQSAMPSSSRCPWSPNLRPAQPAVQASSHASQLEDHSGTTVGAVPPDMGIGTGFGAAFVSQKSQHTHAHSHAPMKRSASPQLPPAVSPASPPARKNPPPKHSTDALAKWFAELACWIWFSPPSSTISGVSLPGTPCRSPIAAYAPLNPSPLSAARRGSHPKAETQSHFSTLSASSDRPDSENPMRLASLEEPFDPRVSPRRKFVAFIRDTLRTTQVSTSVLILALLYIQRLKLQHPRLVGKEGSEYRLSVTAMMLGNKFLDDHTYTNKTWSDISGIPLKEVTTMEIEFWLGLQMRIHVTHADYKKWLHTLEDLSEQRFQAIARRDRHLARRRAALLQTSPRRHGGHSAVKYAVGTRSDFYDLFDAQRTSGTATTALTSPPALREGASPAGASVSPSSQRSYSTAATSASMLPFPETTCQTQAYSPDRLVPSRYLSPPGGLNAYSRASNSAAAPLQTQAGEPWQEPEPFRLPPVSESMSRKRRREEGQSDFSADESRKRCGIDAGLAALGDPTAARHDSRLTPLRDFLASNDHSVHGGPPQQQAPPSDAAAAQDSLYRSVFSQPLTPDCLMQSYAAPHAMPWSSQSDRHLSFYQLAAGREHGLPAYHLPPPPPPPYGHPATQSLHSSRRGSLALAPYAISPRTVTTPSTAPSTTSSHLAPSLRPAYQGHQSHFSDASSAMLPSLHLHYPGRLSPEAYGVSYGGHSIPHAGPAPARRQDPFAAGPDAYGRGAEAAPYGVATPAQSAEERRWVPFSNVPIDMQLQHFQQWQQLGYPNPPQAWQNPDSAAVRRADGCSAYDFTGSASAASKAHRYDF